MRRVLSIATLTFRESVRTKLVHALAAVVALLVGGMPLLLAGDGTRLGQARMVLLYVTGCAFAFLAVASLWAGSAALASDIRGRTLQLVRVKPVRMWQLWLGKWLGLLFVDALLLALVFAGVYAWTASSGALGDDALGVAKRQYPPALPPLEKQIAEMEANIAATHAQGMSPQERRDLRATLRRQLPYATASLRSGDIWRWTFAPARIPSAGETVWLRLGLHTDPLAPEQPVARVGLVSGEAAPPTRAPHDIADFSSRHQEIALPAPDASAARRLELVIANLGGTNAPPLLVQPRQGLVLLMRAGRLEANMARAYAILFALLALLLALGLTAGAFFTLPVAVFATTCLVLSAFASDYALRDPDVFDPATVAARPLPARVQAAVSARVIGAVATLTRPALKPAPLTHLAASEWIPPGEFRTALLGNGLAFPLLLALLSSLHLARKELPE